MARTNPELVIVNLDLHEVKSHLFYSLAVPFPCLFISLCYLVIAYKYIYNDKPEQNDVSEFSNHYQYDVGIIQKFRTLKIYCAEPSAKTICSNLKI